MVETDRAVAFVMDDILLASLVGGSKEPTAYGVIPEAAFSLPEPYGIMLRTRGSGLQEAGRGPGGRRFLRKPRRGKANYDKWFMKPIPPKNLTLNVPMSASLQKVYDKPTNSRPRRWGTEAHGPLPLNGRGHAGRCQSDAKSRCA